MKYTYELHGQVETDEFFTNEELKNIMSFLLDANNSFIPKSWYQYLGAEKEVHLEVSKKGG